MQATILTVDDEAEIREMLHDFLSKRGYRVVVASSAEEARKLLETERVDLALLDITLPGESGLSLARYLREHHDLPIIMLTALDSVIDRIIGLEIGADDYIPKPFDPREVLARIKNVLRRTEKPLVVTNPEMIPIGALTLDLGNQKLFAADGAEIPLTTGEFDLLKIFVSNPNRILSRDRILDLTQQRDWDPFDRSVDIRITRIRKKIEPHPDKPTFIKTIRGVGYQYVPSTEN